MATSYRNGPGRSADHRHRLVRPAGVRHQPAGVAVGQQVELLQHRLADQHLGAEDEPSSSVLRVWHWKVTGPARSTDSLRPSAYWATCWPITPRPSWSTTCCGKTDRTAPVSTIASITSCRTCSGGSGRRGPGPRRRRWSASPVRGSHPWPDRTTAGAVAGRVAGPPRARTAGRSAAVTQSVSPSPKQDVRAGSGGEEPGAVGNDGVGAGRSAVSPRPTYAYGNVVAGHRVAGDVQRASAGFGPRRRATSRLSGNAPPWSSRVEQDDHADRRGDPIAGDLARSRPDRTASTGRNGGDRWRGRPRRRVAMRRRGMDAGYPNADGRRRLSGPAGPGLRSAAGEPRPCH